MKINEFNLQKNKEITVADFKPPFTLGNVPNEVRIALDAAFQPVQSLLQHSLSGLLSAGYNGFVGYGVLLQLCQNPLIRAAVEAKASDMTNRFGEFTIDGDNNDEKLAERCEILNKQLVKYGVQKVFRKGACGAGYFGGTYVFIDILGDEQEDWATPLILSKETIPIGTLRGFKVIDPYLVTPTNYNSINPMADDYFRPQVFYVQGIPVHTSRLMYFGEGEPLPTMIRPAYNFTNISLAQKMLDAVAHYTSCRENAQGLLERCALTVFKTDMSDILSGGAAAQMENRIKYFKQNRNNFGVAAIDKEREELVTQTTALGGITDIVQRAMEYVAAMADEPVTEMWGLNPAGFSTGDADLKKHYEKIEAKREMMFRANIEKVNQLLQYNYFGDYAKEVVFTFAPLTEEKESEKIANNIQKAQYDATLLQNGIIQQEDVRKRLLDDPNSGYNSLEELQDPPPDMQQFIDEPEEEQEQVADQAMAYDDPTDEEWITINGAHIEVDKNGELQGEVGEKIQNQQKTPKFHPEDGRTPNPKHKMTPAQIQAWHQYRADVDKDILGQRTQDGKIIQGVNEHTIFRMTQRKPSMKQILSTLQNPDKIIKQKKEDYPGRNEDRFLFIQGKKKVIVSEHGIIKTVCTNRRGKKGKPHGWFDVGDKSLNCS